MIKDTAASPIITNMMVFIPLDCLFLVSQIVLFEIVKLSDVILKTPVK